MPDISRHSSENQVNGYLDSEEPSWRSAASVLRDLLNNSDETIVCPGVYDGLTARIALRAGFKCLYMVSQPRVKVTNYTRRFWNHCFNTVWLAYHLE